MRALAAIVFLLFLAASLWAQGSAAATNSAKAHLNRKEAKRLRKVKKLALQFGEWDLVRIRSKDHTQVVGWLTKVSNQGIQFTESPKENGHRKEPTDRNLPPPRFISFSQIRSIKYAGSNQWGFLYYGLAYGGWFGPLGWYMEWLLATGRAED